MDKKNRTNLSVRLQPYDGSLLAEVAEWLNTFSNRDKREKISAALTMVYLAYARGADEDISDRELARSCYESANLMEIQISNMFQYFHVENHKLSRDKTVTEEKEKVEKEEEEDGFSLFDD